MPTSTPSTPSRRAPLSYSDISEPQHQLIDALYEGDRLAIAPVGFGKAVCGQSAAQALIADDVLTRVLIVAPLKVAKLTWGSEWRQWAHLREPALALGDARERAAAINGAADIVVINIENLPWLIDNKLHLSFDGLLIDEISKFKSAGSKGVKKLRHILKHFHWRCGLSATPVAEAGKDIYSQALLIDQGAALGTRQEGFLQHYMYPTDYQQRKWAWQPGALPRLVEALGDLIYLADGAGYEAGLPELVDEQVSVVIPMDHYDEMAADGLIEILGVEAPNAAVVSGKLMQVAAGAVYSGEGPQRKTTWIHGVKLAVLERLVAEAAGPVLVSYQFEFERDALVQRGYTLFDGSKAMQDEWSAGTVDVLCLHPKSASHGLNLQYGGFELICLGPVWSADQWAQLLGRLRRRGQKSGFVKRTTIIAKNTVDELVLDRLAGKSVSEQVLMAHLKSRAA